MATFEKQKDDDEFHDAVSNPVLPAHTKTNEEIIAEVIGEQSAHKLPDEDEPEEEEDYEFHDADTTEVKPSPELLDDDLEEQEKLEREKGMTAEELVECKDDAEKLKVEGNELFKNEQIDEAIEVYSSALTICPTKYSKERAILYGNRAAAKIKIDSKKSAIEDCTKALELWPEYLRVLLRRAKLYEGEDKLDEALDDYKRLVELDSSQHEARAALMRLPPLINERNERMKVEMMGKLKELGNTILKPFGLSTNNFQMQQDPNTGGYSINFKQS